MLIAFNLPKGSIWKIKCDQKYPNLIINFIRNEEQYDNIFHDIYTVLLSEDPIGASLKKGHLSLAKFICKLNNMCNNLSYENTKQYGIIKGVNFYQFAQECIYFDRFDIFKWLYSGKGHPQSYIPNIFFEIYDILYIATKNGNINIIRNLIDTGARLPVSYLKVCPAVLTAIDNKRWDIIECFLTSHDHIVLGNIPYDILYITAQKDYYHLAYNILQQHFLLIDNLTLMTYVKS